VFKIGMLTDYGILILTHMAKNPQGWSSAAELSASLNLPKPTVAKVLKLMNHHGLLDSHRGKQGGYRLSRSPGRISITEILEAIEGPLHVTDCALPHASCQRIIQCDLPAHWRVVNEVIHSAIKEISLDFFCQSKPCGLVGYLARTSPSSTPNPS